MYSFSLSLIAGEQVITQVQCLAVSLECEAYTPYAKLTATFLSQGTDYGNISGVRLYCDGREIYFGIADSVRLYRHKGSGFVKVQSRSFTSVLSQNELVPGLHPDMTLQKLITGFYHFPHVSYEPYAGSGYIFVKDGSSMWDSIINFAYKLTGHHPFIVGNTVCFTKPDDGQHVELYSTQVLEYGTVMDTTKLVSMYHMADISENYDAYRLENEAAVGADIVRHKQLLLDRQYLSEPEQALQFRCKFSQRGWRAKYVTYSGFHMEQLCDRVSFGAFLQEAHICRIRMVCGSSGVRTTLWAYDDGFYHIED